MAQVLLVDDDSAAVARAEAVLAAEGHTVVSVSEPGGCVAAVQRVGPDVVVLEAVFQGVVAGFDLARELAAQFPALPLVMISRADQVLDTRVLAEQDVDGWLPVRRYLQKPVTGEVLAYEVEHALPMTH
jgi:CheY-like chemotaxis protein